MTVGSVFVDTREFPWVMDWGWPGFHVGLHGFLVGFHAVKDTSVFCS